MGDTALIRGRYELLELIGRGGMGEVWRARDEALGRRVAVKCLKPVGQHRDKAFLRVLRERFRREARVAAALQHRGVTVVHDFGEDDGVLYLVMELLDGHNLSQILEADGRRPLPVPEVADIAGQIAAALAYTHDQGIVHRDLKPANVMRTADGTVKICDFGIARLGHDIGFTSKLTGTTGMAMGTPHYMSPEQIADTAVDHRSDLYSLGCVLYELATGEPPFAGPDAWAILVGHRDTPPAPPSGRRPGLPGPLERIILALLAKEPELRPRDAAELGRMLSAARRADPYEEPGRHHPDDAYTTGTNAPAPAPRGTQVPPARTRDASGGPSAGASGPQPVAALSGSAQALTGPLTGPVQPPLVVPPGRPPAGEPSSAHPYIARPPAGQAAAAPRPSAADPSGDGTRPGARDTLARLHAEAVGLGRAGRPEEALEAYRRVAAERERLLGPRHPDTLAGRYDVGLALRRLGRHGAALRTYEAVAAARESSLGADHPDTLAVRQESAYVLGRLGRHHEAHRIYTAVLAARERTLGADHPGTLRCRHNLAVGLARLDRPEDSCLLLVRVAGDRARVLGEDHRDTLVTRREAGHALGRLDRWEEALRQLDAVAAARARTLGEDHPDTLAARHETGVCLGRLGRAGEALELYRDLVRARTARQGADHPDTLRARHALGVGLGRLGRWEAALAEAREVAAVRARVLGPEHADTLVSHGETAVALGRLGRWPDALGVYRGIAEARERVGGAAHPGALAGREDEARCLERLGRGEEAAAVRHRVADLRRAAKRHGTGEARGS